MLELYIGVSWVVIFTLFAGRGAKVLEGQHGDLVYTREARQVTRMMPRGPQNQRYLLSEPILSSALYPPPIASRVRHVRSGPEEKYHSAD